MPLYRAGGIAWLALEGLCRQEDIDFEWELLVIEEFGCEGIGEAALRAYEPRLAAVGCRVPITYISLSEWIPLSQKWYQLAELADSNGFLLIAGDDYPNPKRLAETKKIFTTTDAEWVQTPVGYFYDIETDALSIWDYNLSQPMNFAGLGVTRMHPCGLEKAIQTNLLKNLSESDLMRGVDGWLYLEVSRYLERDPKVVWNRSKSWRKGIFTDGFNNLSIRSHLYEGASVRRPFRSPASTQVHCPKCDEAFEGEASRLEDIVPADIALRLRELKSVAENRTKGITGKLERKKIILTDD